MDPDLHLAGAPVQSLAALDTLLRQAREMSEPQVRCLAWHYRNVGDADAVGIQDSQQVERRLRRSHALGVAIARAGGRREARRLESACQLAVRTALAGSPALPSLTRLGIIDDAAAAVTEAAMAILVRERLGPELERDLSGAWSAVIDAPAPAGSACR